MGDATPVRAQRSRLPRASALRARCPTTCARVQPGRRDGPASAVVEAGDPVEDERLAGPHPAEALLRRRHQAALGPAAAALLAQPGDAGDDLAVAVGEPAALPQPTPAGVPVAMTSPGSRVTMVRR